MVFYPGRKLFSFRGEAIKVVTAIAVDIPIYPLGTVKEAAANEGGFDAILVSTLHLAFSEAWTLSSFSFS